MKRKVVVIGGGISGLATAWFLKQTGCAEVTLLERSNRVGGWIRTERSKGYVFEQGPHSFKISRSPVLTQLIADLGLQSEMVSSSASCRYLWHEERLRALPTNPFSFLFSPLTRGVVKALFSEWKRPVKKGDETVWDFAARRFNKEVASCLFDPMVVGIFGGDAREISIEACFPKLKQWEEQHGSLTRAFLKNKRSPSALPEGISFPPSTTFSFRTGIEKLTERLLERISAEVHYGQKVVSIDKKGPQVKIKTEGEVFSADAVFCALPVEETSSLLQKELGALAEGLNDIVSQTLFVVNLGYDAHLLPFSGFGYLMPSGAPGRVMGTVFDSSLFPEQNQREEETRLTVMAADQGQSQEMAIQDALQAAQSHLGIHQSPQEISLRHGVKAIPQYRVGHLQKMKQWDEKAHDDFPECYFLGNYLSGVSVEACVERAAQQVKKWREDVGRF